MLKFIWNSWWRNKERFILLLVGVLILSTGLSYLIGITQANNGTVVDELQKRWESSYHLVVRPQGSRSVTEDLNLLEPNYLSGMEGGISLEQYEQIKELKDIAIAAPIAMMGSITTNVQLDPVTIQEPGIYRMNILEETNTGAGIEKFEGNTYFTVGTWSPEGSGQEYGASPILSNLSYGSEVMVAGIDPAAESELIGIDEATLNKNSRFFTNEDMAKEMEDGLGIQIPVIISNKDYVDAKMTYTFERLDFPFKSSEQFKTMEEIKKNGGQEFLEKQKGIPIENYIYTTEDVHKKLINNVLNPNQGSIGLEESTWMAFKPSPIDYKPVTSPFGKRWPYSYQVKPYKVPEDSLLAVRSMYRPVNMFGDTSQDWPRLKFDYIGVFDPQKLRLSKDPLTELPMETYFPAKAQWVVDAKNQPVNPPTDMKPLNNPYGFLTKPPLILTTIEAAAKVLGDKPISAIRVNVTEVDSLNEESEAKLQAVAKEIEDKTGLITDITLGSSPQLALTHLPGLEGEDALGWVQQPWIKLGSSISIFQEAKIGMSGVIASVILVAIVYVFASNIIMLFARKKEFAVLLSLGWRPSQLSKLLFLESTILGLLVALISWLILGTFLVSGSIDTSLLRVFLIGVSGQAIYWLGSLIPIWLIKRIKPYESMKSGEVSQRTNRIVRAESVLGMSMNNLFTQWHRSLLSIIAIAVPTSLFIFFLFVTFRLKGVLYATWLGEFVALEVGTMHYVAMGVALLIAVLTTTEIMWQNVAERQSQIAVLKATGWQNTGIRLLVLLEGVMSGLLAGILGLGIALIIIYRMYGEVPTGEFVFLFSTILIPIITGVVGAVLPAEKAARIFPYQAISGILQNSKKVEKQFKWAISTVGIGLIVGILSLFIYAIPENDSTSTGRVVGSSEEGTKGKLLPVSSDKDKVIKEVETAKEGNTNNAIEMLQETAYRSFVLGDGTDESEDLKFGALVEPPVDIVPTDKQNQLISIPVTLDYQGTSQEQGASFTYKPQGMRLVDEIGNEYFSVKMEVTEQGSWEKPFTFRIPGKTSVILTYEVPKNQDRFALVAQGEYIAGPFVVEINLKDKRLDNENAISIQKADAWRVLSLGESTGDGKNAPDLTFGELTDVPTGLKASSEENKLISIPVTIKEEGNGPPEGFVIYKPHGYYLYDEFGNEYKVIDMKKISVGEWNKQPSIYKLFLPGEVSVVLTYEVPKNHGELVMIVNGSYTAGPVIVEIE